MRWAAVLLFLLVATPAWGQDDPYARGVRWYQLGQFDRAVEAFTKGAGRRPHDGLGWLWLGASAYRAGRHDLAEVALRRALVLRPHDPNAMLWLGYTYAAQGRKAEARATLDRLQQIAPRSPAAAYARWWLRSTNSIRPAPGRWLDPATYAWIARHYNPQLTPSEAVRIGQALLAYARQFNVDPRLVTSVVAVESGFNPKATSYAGAQGLGQLMPTTARSVGVRRPFDPVENLYGTVRVLRGLLLHYGYHQAPLALAAYNAGRGAVARYGGIPPYSETQWYVYTVLSLYRRTLDGRGL